ncbi:succinate dehydrogenase subunit A [Tessaracoccus bendigoensis DSM 12906]|uniref:Succinate dehydrogenase subunit A n=1 Tax=Tessaracoccus bendigoensis DSM 12906 TaxID=1123357 RepID=A0A1M6B9Y8_9ACTN|nr:fumarate reductase/succinate dehydrogenase flavoprotein subunit [Tessaracoccus bendigoensis]SHI45477.1 succinate dehydrogenase subunit A [Tessaracoccus bendigoensis DSM 12906]
MKWPRRNTPPVGAPEVEPKWRAPRVTVRGAHTGRTLDGAVPDGDPSTAWDRRRSEYKLVSPLNAKRFTVVVVGTGLAGAGAAAALGELGFKVHAFTYHDSPRRAHSVAAQGGINAARARKVDGDSQRRFVVDTVKGGDFRARESEAYRLAQESVRVIDHMSAIGAPFAREYGGMLATRSFGGVQVSRTYYTRGQTGQQLQIAGAQALQRQVKLGTVDLHDRAEMLDLIMDDGVCRGVVVRDLVSGQVWAQPAHAVILATGGYGSVYFHSTLAVNSNATAVWRAARQGAFLSHASFVQFHPTALPISTHWQSKNILMSESLRNDGRIWVPKKPGDDRAPGDIPEAERDYYLERKYPSFGNLSPRDISSRAAKEQIDSGHGVGPLANSVYLDFSDALAAHGRETIAARYGNLFDMYAHATGEDPYTVPMRIAPGAHFTMGGLWSDYDQMTSIPGLFVGGEASWAYHGANRLGANSLLSACVDGWFTLPFSVPNYLAGHLGERLPGAGDACVRDAVARVTTRTSALLAVKGKLASSHFHRELGEIMYRGVGVERTAEGLAAAIDDIHDLRHRFWREVRVPGEGRQLNQALEKAGRVADFLELAELMAVDALDRQESCGAHFRSEFQDGGEARRDDQRWAFASAWETRGASGATHDLQFTRHAEPLAFASVPLATRSYR